MTQDAHTLAELRVLVGFLGEQEPAWWASHFFGDTALAFLTPVFGRSVHQAQYQGVTEAAGLVHDEHIGIGRTCHLFHLPERYEQSAASLIADRELATSLFAHTATPEQALARIEQLATPQSAGEGPVVVGDVNGDLTDHLATIAGLYLDAFWKGFKTFPYLREVE